MQVPAFTSPRSLPIAQRSAVVGAALVVLLSLGACTRTGEPGAQAAASAPAPAASTSGDVVLWADAGLQPVLQPLIADFEAQSKRRVQVQYGDSAEQRRLLGSGAGQADVHVGLAVPIPDNHVLVVHPEGPPPPTLGLPSAWSAPVWLWRDQLCTLSRVPVTPGTVMGQWQRKGVVLAADVAGEANTQVPLSQPVARVLIEAEGLQPGLRDTLSQKIRQWQAQSPAVDALQGVLQNTAHMAIAPCVKVGALGTLPAPVQWSRLSPALSVPLDYGVVLRNGANDSAKQFVQSLSSSEARAKATMQGLQALNN